MKEELLNQVIEEVTTSTPNEDLIKALRMLAISQKDVLNDAEAREYVGVSPTYWQAIKRDRLIPFYLISANKAFFRKADIDVYLTNPDKAQLSSLQLQQRAKELMRQKRIHV